MMDDPTQTELPTGPGLGSRFRQMTGLRGQMGGPGDMGSRFIRAARTGHLQFDPDGGAVAFRGENSARINPEAGALLRGIQERFAARNQPRDTMGHADTSPLDQGTPVTPTEAPTAPRPMDRMLGAARGDVRGAMAGRGPAPMGRIEDGIGGTFNQLGQRPMQRPQRIGRPMMHSRGMSRPMGR